MLRISKNLIFISILFASTSLPQSKDFVHITVDTNFDIMRTAQEYFGNKDYWTYILHSNKLSGLEQIKPGMTLQLPVMIVKRTFNEIEKAKKSLTEAIDIGGKILAEELIAEAEKYYSTALKQADNFNFESAFNSAKEAVIYSQLAYRKTKEIRDKTVDAIISYKKGILQKRKFSALSWIPAALYENLHEKDIARTLSQSNAQITFYDLSQIKLNENSQAVIQSTRFDPITKKSNSKVKLEKGDAYALLQGSPKKKFDFEIPGVKAKINSKYFWIEKGNKDTKLANYNGEIELQAQNQSVVVQKNQGSVIPEGGVPSLPINLPSPPALSSPIDQSLLKDLTITFSWINNPLADTYWIELAKDANFKSVVNLTKNISNTNIKIKLDEAGVFYWHVCSVDKSGLPGPFSETFSFAVSNNKSKPFIMLHEFPSNIFTKEFIYSINGKVSLPSTLKINSDIVSVDPSGNFNYSIKLNEGKNNLSIIVSDTSGNFATVFRNIYYETPNQMKLINLKSGRDFINENILKNVNNHKIELQTIPFALISLIDKSNNASEGLSADSAGRFVISLELTKNVSQYEIVVTSQTGLKISTSFEIILDNQPPFVELDKNEESVNSRFFNISGKTDANKLYINEQAVDVLEDNSFRAEFELTEGENVFEIKALDEAENETVKLEKIIYDNLPPVLIESKVLLPKKKSEKAILLIKASDQTQLKKFAVLKYSIGANLFSEYAKLNEDKNQYEFEFNSSSGIKFISVELEDYFSNKKLYELTQ